MTERLAACDDRIATRFEGVGLHEGRSGAVRPSVLKKLRPSPALVVAIRLEERMKRLVGLSIIAILIAGMTASTAGAASGRLTAATPTVTDGQLSSVACWSATGCMAVGSSSAGGLAELWNGTSWSVVPVAAGSGALRGVSCPSRRECVAEAALAGRRRQRSGTAEAGRPRLRVRPMASSSVWRARRPEAASPSAISPAPTAVWQSNGMARVGQCSPSRFS